MTTIIGAGWLEKPKRVAVVGMGLVTPLGNTLEAYMDALTRGVSGIRYMPEWERIKRLRTKLAGLCEIEDQEKTLPRKVRRSMGRVAVLAALASRQAVAQAALAEEELASPGWGSRLAPPRARTRNRPCKWGEWRPRTI